MEFSSPTSESWEVFHHLTRTEYQPFEQAGIEYLHAQILYNRDIKTVEAMRSFLDARYDQLPDPFSLPDMDRAVARIQKALAERESITVYGDFDADGVTSAALLTRALRTIKPSDAPLDFYIPKRIAYARGFSKEAIEEIRATRKVSLIITTDCGSSDVEAVEYAKSLGIDVIITDHHQPPEHMPQAYALINPHRPDCTYSERYLCGVGVAFKLAQALYRTYQHSQDEEQALLDLVAIGTIGDVAQLLGENHTLVRLGLQQLNSTRSPGLRALIRSANLQLGQIRERDISYVLAPRINAAGRMTEASVAFKLLTTDDELEAYDYAAELEELNQSRQRQTEELMASVREEVQRHSDDQIIVVSGENWPEGIIGLVASRLAEEIQRTVLVISKGPESSRGSARSHNGFNIISALRQRHDLFERYGGHAQAAGFTIANDRIEDLREHLLNRHKNQQEPIVAITEDAEALAELPAAVIEPEPASPLSTRKVDLVITRPQYLNYNTYVKIRQLAPFGAGNPEPALKMEKLRLVRRWLSGADGRHLRMRLAAQIQDARGVKEVPFTGTLMRGGSQLQLFPEGSLVNVIFALEQAWSPPDSESKQEIWLKILHAEVVD